VTEAVLSPIELDGPAEEFALEMAVMLLVESLLVVVVSPVMRLDSSDDE
jgi:hypothetical protein